MLRVCDSYASSHGLMFNPNKTQLIEFSTSSSRRCFPCISFNDVELVYSDHVTHLGHILTFNLDDKLDIVRVVKDMNRKANSLLCTFNSADPLIKCFLVKSSCLSLYGSALWCLSSPALKIIEIALIKTLRKVWNLPYNSHTAIVHCVAHASTFSNLVYKRFSSLICRALSSSPLVYNAFLQSLQCASSFCGYNNLYGYHHLRVFSEDDNATASLIRILRLHHGLNSPVEDVIRTLSCD